MTASPAFDVIFVGPGHNALFAASHLANPSGCVCQVDQRLTAAKPPTASCESFMEDPEDFKKRSRTGSPYENPTSHPTDGQPKGECLTASRIRARRPSFRPATATMALLPWGRGIRASIGHQRDGRATRRHNTSYSHASEEKRI